MATSQDSSGDELQGDGGKKKRVMSKLLAFALAKQDESSSPSTASETPSTGDEAVKTVEQKDANEEKSEKPAKESGSALRGFLGLVNRARNTADTDVAMQALKNASLSQKNAEILRLNQELRNLKQTLEQKEKQVDIFKDIIKRYRHLLSDKDAEVIADDTNWNDLRKSLNEDVSDSPPKEQLRKAASGILMRALSSVSQSSRAALAVTEDDPPEKFIEHLRGEGLPPPRFVSVFKRTLENCDKEWIQEFLDSGGLGALQVAILRFESQKSLSLDQVVAEAQLINCLKAIMNSEDGLQAVIRQNVATLSQIFNTTLKSKNNLMKAQMTSLIAAVAVYSPEGYNTVRTVLDSVENRNIFKFIVECIDRESDVTLKTAMMSLLNAIVVKHPDIGARMKMRNKLKNLELNSVIARIRENEKEPKDADLLTQFDVYDRMAAKDAQEYAEIEFIDGVHLSDPRSVFERVLQKAKGAKAESSLLTILQHLLLIPNEENLRTAIWDFLEKATHKVVSFQRSDDIQKYTLSELNRAIAQLKEQANSPQSTQPKVPEQTQPKEIEQAQPSAPEQVQAAPPPPPPPPPEPTIAFDAPPPPPPPPSGGDVPPPPPGGPPPPPPPPGAPGIPPPPPGAPGIPPPPGAPSRRAKQQPRPTKKMRAFYWQTIPLNRLPQYWKDVDDQNVKVDVEEFETLFSEKEKAKPAPADPSKKAEEKKPTIITLLDSKRANNVSIVRTQFKQTNQELRKQIIELDDALTLDNLNALLKYAPEPEEIETLKNYSGDVELLGPSEKFFMMLISIPRLNAKLSGAIFKKEFDVKLAKLDRDLRQMRLALRELLESKKLKDVLSIILAHGNYLNAGTARGGAYAFKLESLQKLRDVKSNKAGVSLLHYLGEYIAKHAPDCENWTQEVSHIASAAQISLQQLQTDIAALEQKMEALQKDLAQPDDNPESAKYYSVMTEFATRAAYEINKLKDSSQRVEDLTKQTIQAFPGKDDTTVEDIITTFHEFIEAYKAAVEETKKRKELEEKKRQLAERKAKLEAAKLEAAGIKPSTPAPEIPSKSVEELKEERAAKRRARKAGEKGTGILDDLLNSMKNGNFESFIESI